VRPFGSLGLCLIPLFAAALLRPSEAATPRRAISIPGGAGGIGFDDLRYSRRLKRVLVPAGRTGVLVLIDPTTGAVDRISGFSESAGFAGGHGEGITSVDEGEGRLYVTDRTSKKLLVVNAGTRRILSSVPLSSIPDYVRWIPPTREVWVTEPDAERIEVFRTRDSSDAAPELAGSIAVPGGPESLVVDPDHSRAYTHLWSGRTIALDLASRKEAARWYNGCRGSRGIAVDPALGLLFVGCAEGRAVALETTAGRIVGRLDAGDGVDIIDYDPRLRHLYLPGGKSATMAILSVSPEGQLRLVRSVPTAPGAHCVVSDGEGGVFVCEPKAGRLLVFEDGPPAPGGS
jgi:DNA-binding beta-propeller fold protein YncE